MMSRSAVIALAGGLVLVAAASVAAIGMDGDDARTVVITPAQAAAAVSSFVEGDHAPADLTVSDPGRGSYLTLYDVAGDGIAATVDAHTGKVTSLILASARDLSGEIKTTEAEARASCDEFLSTHAISVDGLALTSRLVDHGERFEYVYDWTRVVNGAVVPDRRLVGVDATSGRVYRYLDIYRPYDPPGKPSITQTAAELASLELLDRPTAVVSNSTLWVKFDDAGTQGLVWKVQVTDSVGTESKPLVLAHWLFEVDASTGDTTLVASS